MAVPQRARGQSLEEAIVIVTTAIALKRPIAAIYENHQQYLCPHIIEWNKEEQLQTLCYQYAGMRRSGLAHRGSPSNWGCLSVGKLSAVELLKAEWHSADKHSRPQECIRRVLLDAEKLPE
jgi:hypothetical protein